MRTPRNHTRRTYAADDQSRSARVSRGLRRYHALRREAERTKPADLRALARPGSTVRLELRPLMIAGAEESAALIHAKGGPDAVTPQVRIACEDCGRLGAVLRGLVQRWGETGDPELASRVASVASARRGLLALIGLERVARDVPPLDEYLERAAREAAASKPNGSQPSPQPAPAGDRSAGQDGGDACPPSLRAPSTHTPPL